MLAIYRATGTELYVPTHAYRTMNIDFVEVEKTIHVYSTIMVEACRSVYDWSMDADQHIQDHKYRSIENTEPQVSVSKH